MSKAQWQPSAQQRAHLAKLGDNTDEAITYLGEIHEVADLITKLFPEGTVRVIHVGEEYGMLRKHLMYGDAAARVHFAQVSKQDRRKTDHAYLAVAHHNK